VPQKRYEEASMEKKTKRDIGKMVDAKAKGRQVKKGAATDDAKVEQAEVDARNSKSFTWKAGT